MSAAVEQLPKSQTSMVESLIADRRAHAQALAKADTELMALFESRAQDLEHVCRAVIETALPPGVREEARQLADDLADRMQRVTKARGA